MATRSSTTHSPLFSQLAALLEPLNQTLIGPSEVVLHDFSKLPNTVIAVAGTLTGRTIGDPLPADAQKSLAAGTLRTRVGYRKALPDGRTIRVTTIILRADTEPTNTALHHAGSDIQPLPKPIGALCLNGDLSMWEALNAVTARVMGDIFSGEQPARDMDEMATHLLADAIGTIGVPVNLMHKEHKLAVVARLKAGGFFQLKDAVEQVAGALQVTRFTVYNYLNALDDNT